jgi:hypothetical protein
VTGGPRRGPLVTSTTSASVTSASRSTAGFMSSRSGPGRGRRHRTRPLPGSTSRSWCRWPRSIAETTATPAGPTPTTAGSASPPNRQRRPPVSRRYAVTALPSLLVCQTSTSWPAAVSQASWSGPRWTPEVRHSDRPSAVANASRAPRSSRTTRSPAATNSFGVSGLPADRAQRTAPSRRSSTTRVPRSPMCATPPSAVPRCCQDSGAGRRGWRQRTRPLAGSTPSSWPRSSGPTRATRTRPPSEAS